MTAHFAPGADAVNFAFRFQQRRAQLECVIAVAANEGVGKGHTLHPVS